MTAVGPALLFLLLGFLWNALWGISLLKAYRSAIRGNQSKVSLILNWLANYPWLGRDVARRLGLANSLIPIVCLLITASVFGVCFLAWSIQLLIGTSR